MNRYFLVAAIAGIFVLFGFATMGWWKQESSPVIRIGISPWPGYEFLYLAEQKGFFRDEGLNIELKQFSSPEGDIRMAFERGQLDGMCNTIPDMLQAYIHSGRVPQIVLITDYSNGADVILAKSPIKDVRGLKGKTIAIETLSLGMIMLAHALQREGMSFADVKLANFSVSEMEQALQAGMADAAVTYPPVSLAIQKMDGVSAVFDSGKIPGEIVDIVAIDETILIKNPEIVPALRRAWGRALAYAESHKEDAYALMAAREQITPQEFEESLNGIHIVSVEEQGEAFKPGGTAEKAVALTIETLSSVNAMNKDVGPAQNFIFMQ